MGKTTAMHLVLRENLPEPNSQSMINAFFWSFIYFFWRPRYL